MPKANILIVEDEAVVAADLAAKLERAGYRSVGIAADIYRQFGDLPAPPAIVGSKNGALARPLAEI